MVRRNRRQGKARYRKARNGIISEDDLAKIQQIPLPSGVRESVSLTVCESVTPLRRAFEGFCKAEQHIHQTGCSRRLWLLALGHELELRDSTATSLPNEKSRTAARRQIAEELGCSVRSLSRVPTKTSQYLAVAGQINSFGFVLFIANKNIDA